MDGYWYSVFSISSWFISIHFSELMDLRVRFIYPRTQSAGVHPPQSALPMFAVLLQ